MFPSPADFNDQLQAWLVMANRRQHRTLGCRPADRLEADLAAMLSLPPVASVVGWRTSLRLPRDHYLRVASKQRSCEPTRRPSQLMVTVSRSAIKSTRRPTAGGETE